MRIDTVKFTDETDQPIAAVEPILKDPKSVLVTAQWGIVKGGFHIYVEDIPKLINVLNEAYEFFCPRQEPELSEHRGSRA